MPPWVYKPEPETYFVIISIFLFFFLFKENARGLLSSFLLRRVVDLCPKTKAKILVPALYVSIAAMATLDSDVPMVPVGEASSSSAPSSSTKKPKRFEIKKWSAVSLWAWGTNP